MKTLLTILLASTIWCAATPPPLPSVVTTTKRLQWSASPTPNVIYRLYHSIDDRIYHTNYTTAGTNYTVTVQAGSTNWFMVKAVNADGIESVPSNVYEQPIQPQPSPAGLLQVVPVTTSIETWVPGGEWTGVKTYVANIIVEPNEGRLFRSKVLIGQAQELVKLR